MAFPKALFQHNLQPLYITQRSNNDNGIIDVPFAPLPHSDALTSE
jgi:hypothetical protein